MTPKFKFTHEDIDRMFEEALQGPKQQNGKVKALQALVNKARVGRKAKEETR